MQYYYILTFEITKHWAGNGLPIKTNFRYKNIFQRVEVGRSASRSACRIARNEANIPLWVHSKENVMIINMLVLYVQGSTTQRTVHSWHSYWSICCTWTRCWRAKAKSRTKSCTSAWISTSTQKSEVKKWGRRKRCNKYDKRAAPAGELPIETEIVFHEAGEPRDRSVDNKCVQFCASPLLHNLVHGHEEVDRRARWKTVRN